MEIWKTTENHPNYQISSFFNVKNAKTNRILKPWINHGYYHVRLNGKLKKIHRLMAETFIPNIEGKLYVDHIDRNKLNNHIDNLRWVDRSENRFNTGLQKNNKSGQKNICWHKKSGKWYVQIHIDKKQKRFGLFKKLEDAIKKRDEIYEKINRQMIL